MDTEIFDKLEDMGAEIEDTLDRLMGDEDMYMEYLQKIPQNENIVNLRKAVDEKNYEQALHEIHTLKGVALNLGLLPLADVCMDMLLDFRAGENEKAAGQIDAVEKCFKEVSDIIKGE